MNASYDIRRLDWNNSESVMELLALQMSSYLREAELIGFTDIPPLMDTPQSLRESSEIFLGCYLEQELAGAIAFETIPAEHLLVICRLMVRPDRFRSGIGSHLLRYVLAMHPDYPLIEVTTGAANEPAVRLYERFGFQYVNTREIAPGVALNRMRLVR